MLELSRKLFLFCNFLIFLKVEIFLQGRITSASRQSWRKKTSIFEPIN